MKRMNEKKDLQLILLLNNWADIPFYSSSLPIPIFSLLLDLLFEGRQQNRLEDLLKGLLPSPDEFNKRVGAFTLWTHEDAKPGQTRSPIINNYIHSKAAIIDDVWATVGSANLDVFSLSNEDDSEVNVLLFEDSTKQIADFRRRLWAEHLGLDPGAILDGADFLALWNKQGEEKLNALREPTPRRTDPRILPFPPYPHVNANIAFDVYSPDKYLAGLNIDTRKLNILRAEPAFNFADGKVT
jgi:phosphatidylserine/phosphatidylglycerophosphate/cardiolipin synthase-like enzyme